MLVPWFLNVGELVETLLELVVIVVSVILYQWYKYTNSLLHATIGVSYHQYGMYSAFNRMRAGTWYRARTIPFNVF